MNQQQKKATRNALLSKKSWARRGKKGSYKRDAVKAQRRADKALAKEDS